MQLAAVTVAIAGFNPDFARFQLFRDGAGRVSRLLMNLCAYEVGVVAGRQVSVDRLIEEKTERNSPALPLASRGLA